MAVTVKTHAPKKPATSPSATELDAVLGPAVAVWSAVVTAARVLVPCEVEWRPANPAKALAFGRYAVLQHKGRRLIYLLPRPGAVEVRVMLGERAFGLALEAKLPARIKKLAAVAKVYPEGHYIQIAPVELQDVPGIMMLLECKLAPKE